MKCIRCAPGDVFDPSLERTYPFPDNAVAIFGDRGTQLGYVGADLAPPIGKWMKEDEATGVFQAMNGNGFHIRIRFGSGLPTLPDPVPDVPTSAPHRPMRPAQ